MNLFLLEKVPSFLVHLLWYFSVHTDAYGIVAGQNVSILLLDSNSNVPTFLITAPMINEFTPDIVGK